MYILTKSLPNTEGVTIHGISESDKVMEAWLAGGWVVFDIDLDDPITFLPKDILDFEVPAEE